MENLSKNQEGLLKALAIAFPEAKIAEKLTSTSLKFHTNTITDNQFYNLVILLKYYNKEITLKRSAAKICVELTDKEVENG